MNYSSSVPERIAKIGDLFYSYCEKCKSEKMHFVYFLEHNEKINCVRFVMVCHECWEKSYLYNEINDELNLSPPHSAAWYTKICTVHFWNIFVANSMVSEEDLPDTYPVLSDEEIKGFL